MAVLTEHLMHDFNHFTDKTTEIWLDKAKYPVKLLRQGPEMRYWPEKKAIILDYDDTVNRYGTPPPAGLYVISITEKNPHLKSKHERVFHNFKMLEQAEDPRPYADALAHDFRKGELTYKQHMDACEYAAENFSMVPGFTWTINALREMAYRPFILTASPRELLEKSQNRLTIGMESIEASEFYFDSHGIFERMELNMDETRSRKRDKILQQSVFTKYGFEFMVDNNPNSVKRIAKMAWDEHHIYIVAAENAPVMSGNVSIALPELRYDFTPLLDKTKKLERGLNVVIILSQNEHRDAVAFSHMAVEYCKRALESSGREFENNRDKSLNAILSYDRQMKHIFPSRQLRIREEIRSAQRKMKEDMAKIKLKELVEKFSNNALESKISPKIFSA